MPKILLSVNHFKHLLLLKLFLGGGRGEREKEKGRGRERKGRERKGMSVGRISDPFVSLLDSTSGATESSILSLSRRKQTHSHVITSSRTGPYYLKMHVCIISSI